MDNSANSSPSTSQDGLSATTDKLSDNQSATKISPAPVTSIYVSTDGRLSTLLDKSPRSVLFE